MHFTIFRVVLHNWLLWRSSHENYQKESSLLLFTVQLSFGCKNKMNNSNGLEDHTGMMTGEEWVFESTGSSYMFLVDEPSLFWILKDWSVSWFHLAQPNPLCMSFKSLLYVHLWQQLIVIRYKKTLFRHLHSPPDLIRCLCMSSWDLSSKRSIFVIFSLSY